MLFSPIEPYFKTDLRVSALHTLYVEACGNPKGIPILFLHGGPGAGIDADHRRLFDPEKFNVILFDQRGCGKSTPYGELKENSTVHLIEDIEKIRHFFKIDRWHVFGGSWGSFLSLAYAEKYPTYVRSIILRGLFLGRKEELAFFYQKGASFIYPENFTHFKEGVSTLEQGNLIQAYYKRLTSSNPQVVQEAARRWSQWEASCLKLVNTQKTVQDFAKKERLESLARIEAHYFVNECFIHENQLLDEADVLKNIPMTLVHGRYDLVCPFENAYLFKQKAPHTQLYIAGTSGHSYKEKQILKSLMKTLSEIQS